MGYFCGSAGVTVAASVAGISVTVFTSFAFIEQQDPADAVLTFLAFAPFAVEHVAPSSTVHSLESFFAVVEHEAPSVDAFFAVDLAVVAQHDPDADFFAAEPVPQFPPAIATVIESTDATARVARMRTFMCISLKNLVLCRWIAADVPRRDRKNMP